MVYKFKIDGRLDGGNKTTNANRTNAYVGNNLKQINEEVVILHIYQQLRGVHIDKPVLIYYRFFEPNLKRDNDNILSGAAKVIQDALVKTEILKNDTQKCIPKFYFDTFLDRENPRIEVTIVELTKEQAKMRLVEMLKSLESEI